MRASRGLKGLLAGLTVSAGGLAQGMDTADGMRCGSDLVSVGDTEHPSYRRSADRGSCTKHRFKKRFVSLRTAFHEFTSLFCRLIYSEVKQADVGRTLH